MLAKLLKYDLKAIYRVLGFYYVIVIISTLVLIITNVSDGTNGLIEFIRSFAVGCSFGLSIGILVNVITRSWQSFQKNLYGNEAYLMHTLPVTKRQLFSSKILACLIAIIFSLAVTIFAFLSYTGGINTELAEMQQALRSAGSSLWQIIATILLELFFVAMCGFAGILIGHRKNDHRGIWSWAAGGALYIGASLLILGVVLIWSLFDSSISSFLFGGSYGPIQDLIFKVICGVDILYIVAISAICIIAQKTFDRGVDVE